MNDIDARKQAGRSHSDIIPHPDVGPFKNEANGPLARLFRNGKLVWLVEFAAARGEEAEKL